MDASKFYMIIKHKPKPIKPKRCKSCRELFTPFRPLQVACSQGCAQSLVTEKREKEERKKAQEQRKTHREAIVKAKPMSWHKARAQTAFNRYICLRDELAGYGCISCGTQNPNTQYCAGHYRTRGAASQLSFNEDNVHRQCNKRCNLELSGNIREYRPALIERIGQERVNILESNNETKRWTKEELNAIREEYIAKAKALK